jgi:hypothetical protein
MVGMVKRKGSEWEERSDETMEILRLRMICVINKCTSPNIHQFGVLLFDFVVLQAARAFLHNAATENPQCLVPVRTARTLHTSRSGSRRCVRQRNCTGKQLIFRSYTSQTHWVVTASSFLRGGIARGEIAVLRDGFDAKACGVGWKQFRTSLVGSGTVHGACFRLGSKARTFPSPTRLS